MREFFVKLMQNLKRLTGLKQYEEIASLQPKEKAQAELDALVDTMVRVCNSFSYIPDVDKQRIIRNKLIEDPELFSINAKVIYRWLLSASARYNGESHHLEVNKIETVEQKEWSEETKKMVSNYMSTLKAGLITKPIGGVEKEMEKIKAEDKERVDGRQALNKMYNQDREQIHLKHTLHMQWIKENYRTIPNTDMHEKLSCFMEENEWRESKGWYLVDSKLIHAKSKEEAQETFLNETI